MCQILPTFFFTSISVFHSIHNFAFSHEPKMNLIFICSNKNNCNIIDAHIMLLCHIMTTIAYFWLKSKIYLEKLLVTTNNTLMQAINFISIYAFWDINCIILQHLYLAHQRPNNTAGYVTLRGKKWEAYIHFCYCVLLVLGQLPPKKI